MLLDDWRGAARLAAVGGPAKSAEHEWNGMWTTLIVDCAQTTQAGAQPAVREEGDDSRPASVRCARQTPLTRGGFHRLHSSCSRQFVVLAMAPYPLVLALDLAQSEA